MGFPIIGDGVAHAFLDQVFRLHDILESIVYDMDKILLRYSCMSYLAYPWKSCHERDLFDFFLFLAADIILWKCWGVSVVIIVVATVAWLVFEKSGLSFLTISSDVLLILIILRFIWVNSAGMLNKSLSPLPELVLSEEMVNNAAASFRVKVNNMLLVAHDIAHGKDFRSFFQVVVFLWLFSVIGSFFSFATIAYIGMLLLICNNVLFSRFTHPCDRHCFSVNKSKSHEQRQMDVNKTRAPKNARWKMSGMNHISSGKTD
ncbi:Reticulon-like protein B16 [Platanthera zijinensis]|uniref:Reticulon-like protein n=1 Tax=Platanthera zijinensis TaxID=2320716 RepID=A0AAP0BQP3_9ASPA